MIRMSLLGLVLITVTACSSYQPAPAPAPARPYAPPTTTVRRTMRPATPPPTTDWPRTLPVTPSAFSLRDLPLAQVQAQSRSQGRPALLFFTADWCGFCAKLEQRTLSRPNVQQRLRSGFVAVEYDVDKPTGRQLASQFGARGFPTIVIVDAAGNALGKIVGFRSPEEFLQALAAY